MSHFLATLLLGLTLELVASKTLLPTFYHTTESVKEELERLAGDCNGRLVLEKHSNQGDDAPGGGDEVMLDVARLRFPGRGSDDPRHRVAMLFGEHARELITVESGLHFLRNLCTEGDSGSENNVLLGDNVAEMLIFANANPIAREKVENGEFCRRVNEDGVDINRNWDNHWSDQDVSPAQDSPPGPHPFSEPEDRIIRESLKAYQPTVFISVHSGNLGVFVSPAYKPVKLDPASKLTALLQQVSASCSRECHYGTAGEFIGYSSPGSSLDYASENLKVPHAYAVEIWHGVDDGSSLLEEGYDSGEGKLAWCLSNFNPTEEQQFQETLERWNNGYIQLIKGSTSATVVALAEGGGEGQLHTVEISSRTALSSGHGGRLRGVGISSRTARRLT